MTTLKLGICIGILAISTIDALAQGTSPSLPSTQTGSGWSVSATPYGWLPFLKGDQTVKGRTVDIDVNPIQVLEHLDAAPWMSYVEARKGPLALYNDIFFAKLGIAGTRARDINGILLNTSADVDFEQTIVEVGAAYEIAKWRSGGSIKDNAPARFTALDLLVGARYWHQNMTIGLTLAAFDTTGLDVIGGRAFARSGSVDWVDPLVGFRVRQQLAPGHELVLRADVGGFDVGSQISWNVLAAYSWDFAVRDGVTYSGLLGYRALSVDYVKGEGLSKYEYDVLQHGPVMGISVRF